MEGFRDLTAERKKNLPKDGLDTNYSDSMTINGGISRNPDMEYGLGDEN